MGMSNVVRLRNTRSLQKQNSMVQTMSEGWPWKLEMSKSAGNHIPPSLFVLSVIMPNNPGTIKLHLDAHPCTTKIVSWAPVSPDATLKFS
jgi:hypothetical protein